MFFLEITQGPGETGGRRQKLTNGEFIAGRDLQAGIPIADPRVSFHHLTILVAGESVRLRDHNSTNGSYLNGNRFTTTKWNPGEVLQIGDTTIILRQKKQSQENHSTFWKNKNLTFSVVEEKFVPWNLKETHSAANLQIVYSIVSLLQRPSTPAEVLNKIMLRLLKFLDSHSGYVLLWDDQNSEDIRIHLAFEKGVPRPNLQDKFYSKTLVEKVFKERKGLLFDLDETDQKPSHSVLQLKIRSAICCPIYSEHRVLGVLYLDRISGMPKFNASDLDLVLSASGITGMVLENVELYRKLESEAAIRESLKRFVSPNIADHIISEQGMGNFHLQSQKSFVTILFVDIRGFTSLTEKLAPSDVARLLDGYFSEMSEEIFANGGTLDKFIGDSVMALFNAPFAVPDPGTLAVKTALGMRNRLNRRMNEWLAQGLPFFQAGFGINCGEAIVGRMGTSDRMEYSAIGDCVNVASRICSLAKPGQILATSNLVKTLPTDCKSKLLGPANLKGKSRAVEIHEILDWES